MFACAGLRILARLSSGRLLLQHVSFFETAFTTCRRLPCMQTVSREPRHQPQRPQRGDLSPSATRYDNANSSKPPAASTVFSKKPPTHRCTGQWQTIAVAIRKGPLDYPTLRAKS
ncbi:hypothetical protein K466DRAFT_592648 [Polyporus arcularius HHB13444]|uniref:Secreted protein n=1 Tax=Polyporus arcularius HHB13444 TaxID=1314778 RepID=A0A5C3NZL7_9APHY|nr:hypothetical protein K466DRAFT_592648 [Polyporus arcularius HHB13444]